MALDKATLQTTLKDFFVTMKSESKTEDELAAAIADAIDVFVKSGTVTTTDTVSVVDPISGTLTGTGTGTGSVS